MQRENDGGAGHRFPAAVWGRRYDGEAGLRSGRSPRTKAVSRHHQVLRAKYGGNCTSDAVLAPSTLGVDVKLQVLSATPVTLVT